jgi:hypothetical protein
MMNRRKAKVRIRVRIQRGISPKAATVTALMIMAVREA